MKDVERVAVVGRIHQPRNTLFRWLARARGKVVHGAIVGATLLLLSACRSAEPSSSVSAPPSTAGATPPVRVATSAQTRELVLHVEGLTCEGCAWQIRETLQKESGITDVKATVADKRVVVTYDPLKATSTKAKQALERVGYNVEEIRQ